MLRARVRPNISGARRSVHFMCLFRVYYQILQGTRSSRCLAGTVCVNACAHRHVANHGSSDT